MKRINVVIIAICFLKLEMVLSQETGTNLAYPPDIAAWSEAEKASQRTAGEALIPEIIRAIASGKPQFIIEPGNYRFSFEFLNNLSDSSKRSSHDFYASC